ncbi:MAG: DUF2927 domain-containing protein [Rhodospirillales bacterium]|nr:DUF2927 domain-containing protein [Rhodospirillales bacterium]
MAQNVDGKERLSMVLEKLTQALGPINDTTIYPDGILYENFDNVKTIVELSPLDKKLLRFLYTHLNPGDREEDVRRAFEKYWDTINVK